MRKVKLTLSADRDMIAAAKAFASREGTTLSSMFARFLSAVLGKARTRIPYGSVTRKATGLVKLPGGRTDRELLDAALADKFGP